MEFLASLHPQVVHFVIGLLIIGVLARILSLVPAPRLAFLGPMAAVLIFLGTAAAVVAVKSGTEAHEAVESMPTPGVRAAVQAHEDWGHHTRDIFLVVSVLEIGILALAARKPGIARGLRVASALVGIAGIGALYEAGDRGGDLVYEYAGGVGIRSGDTTDVRRLLAAGLYNNSRLDRRTGGAQASAQRIAELQQMYPSDTNVRLLVIESAIRDRKDPHLALAMLDSLTVPDGNRFLRFRKALLQSQAYQAAGMKDSARAVLEGLKRAFPQNRRIDQLLKELQ